MGGWIVKKENSEVMCLHDFTGPFYPVYVGGTCNGLLTRGQLFLFKWDLQKAAIGYK